MHWWMARMLISSSASALHGARQNAGHLHVAANGGDNRHLAGGDFGIGEGLLQRLDHALDVAQGAIHVMGNGVGVGVLGDEAHLEPAQDLQDAAVVAGLALHVLVEHSMANTPLRPAMISTWGFSLT